MLLKSIEKKNIFKQFKLKYFSFQNCILNTQQQINIFFKFLLFTFSFIPNVCILFRLQPFSPSIINKFFHCFLFPQLSLIFRISSTLVYSFILSFVGLLILSYVYTYNNQIINSFSSKLLTILINFMIYLKVPIIDGLLHIVGESSKNFQSQVIWYVFKILGAFMLAAYMVIMLLYLKFKLKPLRNKNNQWKLDNRMQLFQFLLNISRTSVFYIDGISLKYLIISLALQLIWRYSSFSYYLTPHYHICISTCSNCIISTYIGVIIFILTDKNTLATNFWIILLCISLIQGFYEYFNQMSRPLQLPVCNSTSFQFYDFYFRIIEKYQSRSQTLGNNNNILEQFYMTIFKQHIRKCNKNNCYIKDLCIMPKNIMTQLQKIILEELEQQKNINPYHQILQELFKLEHGKKFTLRNLKYQISLEYQFIIYFIEKNYLSQQGTSLTNDANLINRNSLKFYQNINKILLYYYQFYQEIIKPSPKMENLMEFGLGIRQNFQIIQRMYKQLLKKKTITFQAIEFFIQFQNAFLKKTTLNSILVKKITELQKNFDNDDIQKIQYPALSIYCQNGLIENINMQCLSLLKQSRFQIKSKSINQIFVPTFKPNDYFDLQQQQRQTYYIFIKRRNQQYSCGHLRLIPKFKNNKKFNIYIFNRQKKIQLQNFILINQKYQIVNILCKIQYIKQKKKKTFNIINWIQIFDKYVKQKTIEFKNNKVLRIQIKQLQSYLICTSFKTFNQDYRIISLKIIKNIKEACTKQRRSILINPYSNGFTTRYQNLKRFVFYHDLNKNSNAILVGRMKQKQFINYNKMQRSMSFQVFVGKIKTNLIHQAVIMNKQYQKGIKTYRLYENQLYNIDLQDKQAYIQEIADAKNIKKQSQNKNLFSFSDTYIIAFVILIAVVLTSLSIFLYFELNNKMDKISSNFIRINQIDQFKLNFYRMLAILRDVASGLYKKVNRDWKSDLLSSYQDIFQKQNLKLFKNDIIYMKYAERIYQGNLNQLIQVLLQNIYSMTYQLDYEGIQNIHDTAILQLTDIIQTQQNQFQYSLTSEIQIISQFSLNILCGIVGGIIIFYILMLILCMKLSNDIKKNLSAIMIISDTQARKNQQNTQKFIYAIDMIKKNYQIDVKSLLIQKKNYKPRKKQKQLVVGFKLKIFIGIIILIFMAAHIACIFLFRDNLDTKSEQFLVMKSQGEDIIGSYANLCKQTNRIQHTGQLNYKNIQQMRIQIRDIQRSRGDLSFHSDTNQAILNYFFENSCQRIIKQNYFVNAKGLTCEQSTPGYQIPNPFILGLQLYFSRLHYNMIDKISQTYASTGIYSFPFSKIFVQLSQKISVDGQQKLDIFITISQKWMILFIVIDICYCIVAVILSIYVKKKISQVQKLIKFLDNNRKNKECKEEQKDQE